MSKIKKLSLNLNESLEVERTTKTLWAELKEGVEEMAGIRDTVEGAQASAKALIRLQGQRLNSLKELVGHGEFLKELAKRCPQIATTTAQNYMRLANIDDAKYATVAHLNVSQLYRLAGIPMDEAKPKTTPTDLDQEADNPPTPAFTLADALKLARPSERLSLDDVLTLPDHEQWEVRAALEHAHAMFEALPERPAGQPVPQDDGGGIIEV